MEPDQPHYPGIGIGRYDDPRVPGASGPGEDDNQHQHSHPQQQQAAYSAGTRRDRDMYTMDSSQIQSQLSPNKRRHTSVASTGAEPLLGVHGEPIPYQPAGVSAYFGSTSVSDVQVQEKSLSQQRHQQHHNQIQTSTSSSYLPIQRENYPLAPVGVGVAFSPLQLLHPSQHPPGMSNADVLTCQNVELFQKSDRTFEHDTSAGDIGIRCIHCARTDVNNHNVNSIFIPSSMEMIDSGLRMMSKNHFLKCVMLPESVREEFHTHDMHRRLNGRDRDSDESGRRRRQDMNYRKALSDYCIDMCHRVNIINRHPLQTGIIIGTAISSLRTSPPHNIAHSHSYTSRENDRTQIQMGLDQHQDHSRPTWSPAASTHHLDSFQQPRRTSGGTNLLNAPQSPSRNSNSYRQQRNSPSSFDSACNPATDSHGGHFPFIQTAENVWECQYCSNLPIGHRAERHAWYSSSSPDRGFMETHLQNCQGARSNSKSSTNSVNIPYPPQQSQSQSNSRSSYNSSNQYMPQSSSSSSSRTNNNPYGNQGPQQSWNQYNNSKVSNRHSMNNMNMPNEQSQWRQQQYSNSMSSSGGANNNLNDAWNIPSSQHQRDHSSFLHQQHSPFAGPSSSSSSRHSHHNPLSQQNYSSFSDNMHNQYGAIHPAANMGLPTGPGTSSTHHQIPPFNASAKEDFEAAMTLLKDAEKTFSKSSSDGDGPESETLVEESDKYLITDYFYHVMRQLRICRFKEGDRTTRGGKRDNIAIGYGGLECVHCSNTTNARKFFWSNVDRLSNSFSEIPGHVLKCKACPTSTKDALLELKKCHPAQMTERPRGSQKTFLRRVWRRLHEENEKEQQGGQQQLGELLPIDSIVSLGSESPNRPGIKQVAQTVEEGAKALVAGAGDPDFGIRVLLAIDEDKRFGLANLDCLVRQNIELFRASEIQVKAFNTEKEKGESISVGQVGIQCIHCSSSDQHDTYHSYPPSLDDLFTAVRAFKSKHLLSCPCFPRAQKDKFESLKESSSSSFGSIVRTYYLDSAQALGLRNDKSGGIKATGKSKPIKSGQSANRR
uniref:Uncharacterized protein n=1 Tax=Chaetoceros debilis TaxID=122233 RepID=A0A7S3VC12_9STRA